MNSRTEGRIVSFHRYRNIMLGINLNKPRDSTSVEIGISLSQLWLRNARRHG